MRINAQLKVETQTNVSFFVCRDPFLTHFWAGFASARIPMTPSLVLPCDPFIGGTSTPFPPSPQTLSRPCAIDDAPNPVTAFIPDATANNVAAHAMRPKKLKKELTPE
jgi:hypothetical protein